MAWGIEELLGLIERIRQGNHERLQKLMCADSEDLR